jgi:hypothetical protein
MPEAAEPHVQVNIRIPRSMLEAIQKAAKEHEKKTGVSASVSDIVRSLVRDGLRRGR